MTIRGIVGTAVTWPVSSQQQACRNAMLASTALLERRRERVEVEEFLAAASARRVERSA